MADFLLYGATGYTGSLIARAAAARGLRPRLAGRDAGRVAALGDDLGLESRAVRLDDPAGLDAALRGVPAVLHCAGPFRTTSAPMADACLRTGTHYLDLTGEVGVFEALAERDAEARGAGVMLLPGVGFDVVPTDCLAVHLKGRLPTATHLALASQHPPWTDARGRLRQPSASHGTLATLFEGQLESGLVRREGALVRVPLAARVRHVDLGLGLARAVQFPLGEVSSTYRSTGIPNVETYVVLPLAGLALLRYLGPVLRRVRVPRGLLPGGGPSDEELDRTVSYVWGEVRDDAGRRAVARLRMPGAYAFTVAAALAAIERVQAGRVDRGFQTPATAFGPDFVLGIPGVTRRDDAA